MSRKNVLFLLTCVAALSLAVACSSSSDTVYSMDTQVESSGDHTGPADYTWNGSETTYITLNGDSISVEGDGAVVDGSRVTIVAAGAYSISGSLADGQIIVKTEDDEPVELILNGVTISSSTSAPIYVEKAEEAVLILEDSAENYVSDGTSYVFENAEEDEPNAAIFSKADLSIYGNGTLTVAGNHNDGIASKDGLTINGGTLVVNAVDDGMRGKDYLVVTDGQITVNAQGDGLKSDNEEDAEKGYITIGTGVINVTAGGDAIQAQTNVTVADGNITLFSGGGSNTWIDETLSAKGIKATVNVTIHGGTFTIDSADDAIHSNDSIVINGGAFNIASGDDGMHADSTLEVNAGDITITRSYEGIESAVITINNGAINITSNDDGLNVAGGNDGSGMMREPGQGGGREQGGGPGQGGWPAQGGEGVQPGQGGDMGQGFWPGQDGFAATGSYYLYINGGHIVINAAGDGIDSNGTIEMTGGVVLVNGPTERMNGALDYMGNFTVTGGYLVAVGSSGMAQAPGESSLQYSLLINFNSTLPAGTLIHIQDGAGTDILTFAPTKEYQSIAFSSPGLVAGATYTVYYGGSSSGVVDGGLYQGGTYTPGTPYTDFTVSSVVTRIGNAGRW